MTERHMGYIVMLDENMRADDDSQAVIAALRMIRGVVSVVPVTADYEADVIAVRRRDSQWRARLLSLLDEMRDAPSESRRRRI